MTGIKLRRLDTKKYFYRNIIFSKQGQTISAIDIHNPNKAREEFDPWFGIVLQLADGQHNIDQLIQFMTTQYKGAPPHNLAETILSVVQRMADSRLIVLTEEPTELPYYLTMPYELLDIERAKKEIAADRVNLN